MTAFAYNINVYVNTKKISYKLLKNYVTSFVNVFKNKILKKNIFNYKTSKLITKY